MVLNLSVVIGPALGGLLAGIFSYALLFVLDAVTSFIMVAIVLLKLPETRPDTDPEKPQENRSETYLPGVWLVLSWTVVIVLLWFFFTHRIERFLFPAHVLAAVLGSLGWLRLSRLTSKIFALIPLLLLFLLISFLILLS